MHNTKTGIRLAKFFASTKLENNIPSPRRMCFSLFLKRSSLRRISGLEQDACEKPEE
ncbi:unnamed protein product, partial [Nesidiocoris tenuis]